MDYLGVVPGPAEYLVDGVALPGIGGGGAHRTVFIAGQVGLVIIRRKGARLTLRIGRW